MLEQLPPNQRLAAPGKFPLVGEKSPRIDSAPWTLSVIGLVSAEKTFTFKDLNSLPQSVLEVDIHCVTRWSILGAQFTGIELSRVLEVADIKPEAKFVSFIARSDRSHSSSLPLKDAIDLGAFIAFTYGGKPLPTEHGGPMRLVVPGRYFYKSVKWLERIELLAEDKLGFWEAESGYHNHADPLAEERYIASNIDPKKLKKLLGVGLIEGQTILSLQAERLNLSVLRAEGAIIRNANFKHAQLKLANFNNANLSNADFSYANCHSVTFRDADLEGANFEGADIQEAIFSGASLFGTTFFTQETGAGAIVDETTVFDVASFEKLAPEQAEYLLTHDIEVIPTLPRSG
ncbi:MAG: molybdopterin-dependent oxidoreductase [Chthonomonadales bacterium]